MCYYLCVYSQPYYYAFIVCVYVHILYIYNYIHMNDAHHTTSAIASSAYHSTPSISHGGQAHAMIMTYIQPIVLQEGVHTIRHCAYVCRQRGSCILMYALVSIYNIIECLFVCLFVRTTPKLRNGLTLNAQELRRTTRRVPSLD